MAMRVHATVVTGRTLDVRTQVSEDVRENVGCSDASEYKS